MATDKGWCIYMCWHNTQSGVSLIFCRFRSTFIAVSIFISFLQPRQRREIFHLNTCRQSHTCSSVLLSMKNSCAPLAPRSEKLSRPVAKENKYVGAPRVMVIAVNPVEIALEECIDVMYCLQVNVLTFAIRPH